MRSWQFYKYLYTNLQWTINIHLAPGNNKLVWKQDCSVAMTYYAFRVLVKITACQN